ncbi:cyclophilin-like fold protein [Pantoea sp. S-LA4]
MRLPLRLVTLGLLSFATSGFVQPKAVAATAAPEEKMITMRIDQQPFTLVPADNAASRALMKQLPLSVEMHELNGNEKFTDLTFSLPVGPVVTGEINAGDVMLYGTHTLVLFYRSFQTSYRYTRIGRIAHPETLEQHAGMKAAKISVTLSP